MEMKEILQKFEEMTLKQIQIAIERDYDNTRLEQIRENIRLIAQIRNII